jgi:transposase
LVRDDQINAYEDFSPEEFEEGLEPQFFVDFASREMASRNSTYNQSVILEDRKQKIKKDIEGVIDISQLKISKEKLDMLLDFFVN